ncbi:MAG: AraC family transcriptional regulator [Eubacteriales bacterium]|nr:AraC family transcriptional regulator [Eubacteriales bacterium]
MSELMRKIERLWGMPIFFMRNKQDKPESFGSFPDEGSPFVYAPFLVEMLTEKCESQKLPVIYKDENQAYFICVGTQKGFWLVGLMCTENMDYARIHRLYRHYYIPASEEKPPMKVSLLRILTFAGFLYELEGGESVEESELLAINSLVTEEDARTEKEDTILEMRKVDDEVYHHTYQEERYVMDCIREGNEEAVWQRMGAVIESAGILSNKTINHYRYLAIVSVSMATREAIAGGVSPARAYRKSDIYINKIDKCAEVEELVEYCRIAGCEFARMVAEAKSEKNASSYTEQCKDYIYKNYHHKIHLEDVARAIGISQGHLSRVFREDTGMSIQDYIQKFRVERAANLLKYSEASLSEISDYVCFYSQSHFGSVFKRYMQMTPKEYRDKYKEKEFRSENIK